MTKASLRDLDPALLSGRPVLVPRGPERPDGGRSHQRRDQDPRIASDPASADRRRSAPVLLSHFGRPKGRDASQSLRPVAARLGELLGGKVRFHDGLVGPDARAAVASLRDGEVLVLENTRFEPGETKNDPELGRQLPSSPTSSSTTRSAPPIGRTPRPRAWPRGSAGREGARSPGS
jgi:hypothetical protein